MKMQNLVLFNKWKTNVYEIKQNYGHEHECDGNHVTRGGNIIPCEAWWSKEIDP